GSSAFNTLVVTFVFNIYFTNVIAPSDVEGTILWGRAVNLSAVVVALLMPVLGAIADYSGRKKVFLVLFSLQSIVFTCLLFFMGPGDAWAAAALFVVANIGFESANVFYNAFLPEVSSARTIGRISGIGYFLGYIGGLICLALGLGMVRGWLPEADDLNVRATNLLVAGWFFVFSLPMFFGVRERAERRGAPEGGYVRVGFQRLRETTRHLRELREATKLIVARMIYNDGLTTVIVFAGVYAAAVLGMEIEQVLAMGIALNVAAGIGAFAFGFIDDRIGGKRTIVITLLGLIVAGVVGVNASSVAGFWLAATLIGVMMGPNQSASRSLLAKLVPEHKHAEAFGLYAFSGKMSSLLGPLAYTTALAWTGNHRVAMGSIVGFFAVGLLLLLGVREREGIELAARLNDAFEVERAGAAG
ncbi:MAG: MFS transporter, partial [Gemmatimonadetes bacterium]|nr:MFS transporter [Gemmatimonadota bacterium]